MKCKRIEAFIRQAIRADKAAPDVVELQRLLDGMTTDEMQSFWTHFAAGQAFSAATTSVPDWRPKEQMTWFQHEHMNYVFYPKDKDANGRYIIVRTELEEHIKTCLLRYINQEQLFEQAYRRRPLFDRLRARIGFSIVIMLYLAIPIGICFFMLDHFFHIGIIKATVVPAVFIYGALYLLYLLMPLVRAILRK
jgi:hypothetical protein